jgi:hypothetical protein
MNTKTTLLLALLAAVVGGYVAVDVYRSKGEKPEATTVAAKALFEPKPKDINRVEVTAGNAKFAFKKQDNAWSIVSPMQAPAADMEVNALVDKAADIKYLKAYEKGDKDRPSEAVSGLGKPETSVKLFNGDKLEAEVLVGEALPTGKGTYVGVGGKDTVYETQSDVGANFVKRLADYRDKQVLKFDLKDVKRVKVQGLQNYDVAQQADSQWVIESPTRGRGDKEKVDKVVRPLTTLRVQEFKDDAPITLKAYGLDRPRLKLTVEVSKQVPPKAKPGDPNTQPADTQPSTENKTYALLIGGAADMSGSAYFAKLESAPWVFSLTDANVKEFSPAVSDLRDAQLAKIDAVPSVMKVEAVTPAGQMVVTKSDKNEWSFADGAHADAAAVEDLVRAAQNLRATDFVDASDKMVQFNWDKPRAKVTFTRRGELNPIALLIGDVSASGKMVYAKNAAEDTVGAIKLAEAEPFLAAPVTYQDRSVMRLPLDQATRVEIARAGGDSVVLAKADNKWSMTSPIEGAADGEAVRNLLADLASLRAKRVVAVGDQAKYGLDKPAVTVAVRTESVAPAMRPASTRPAVATQPVASAEPVLQGHPVAPATAPAESVESQISKLESLLDYQRTHPDKENKKMTEVLQQRLAGLKAQAATQPAGVGVTGAEAVAPRAAASQPVIVTAPPKTWRLQLAEKDGVVYASVEGQPTVYELEKKIYDDMTAEMFERQVIKYDVANVVELSVEHGQTLLTLRKTGDAWKYVQDPMVPIDSQKVTEVLNVFRDLKTHRYVAYAAKDLAKYHLESDIDRMSVSLNTGEKLEIVLAKVGPDNDADKSRFAMRAGTQRVFLLKGDQAVKFGQKLEDFEKSAAKPGATPGMMPPPQPSEEPEPISMN